MHTPRTHDGLLRVHVALRRPEILLAPFWWGEVTGKLPSGFPSHSKRQRTRSMAASSAHDDFVALGPVRRGPGTALTGVPFHEVGPARVRLHNVAKTGGDWSGFRKTQVDSRRTGCC